MTRENRLRPESGREYKDEIPIYGVDEDLDPFNSTSFLNPPIRRSYETGETATVGVQAYERNEDGTYRYDHTTTTFNAHERLMIQSYPLGAITVRSRNEAWDNTWKLKSVRDVRGYFLEVTQGKFTINLFIVLKVTDPLMMQSLQDYLAAELTRDDTPQSVRAKLEKQFGNVVEFIVEG